MWSEVLRTGGQRPVSGSLLTGDFELTVPEQPQQFGFMLIRAVYVGRVQPMSYLVHLHRRKVRLFVISPVIFIIREPYKHLLSELQTALGSGCTKRPGHVHARLAFGRPERVVPGKPKRVASMWVI